jgi:ubiquinone/menaquinone biosynthesis C-methylase UbiE
METLAARARHAALAPYLTRVVDALALPDEGYALDLGCGDGAAALAVARERPEMTVVGIDPAPRALLLARTLARKEGLTNVNFVEGDAKSPPDAMFERLFALSVFNLLADKRAALVAWRKVTLRGGRLVLGDDFDMRSAGTAHVGAASLEGLSQLARETGWRVQAREDLTTLVSKLNAKGAWSTPENIRKGIRHALVVLT